MTPVCHPAITARAVIDWVEVRVSLRRPTQARHIRERLLRANPQWGKAPYLNPIDADSSGSTRTFTLKVQDPAGPDHLLLALRTIPSPQDEQLGESAVEVVGLEVSMDLYRRASDAPALVELAHHLFRNRALLPDGTARITGPQSYAAAALNRDIERALGDGLSINVGEPGADHVARTYVKKTDTRGGAPYQTLQPREWRARSEVTLRGDSLPFGTLAQWRAYDFTDLGKYFALRKETPPPHKLARTVRAATAQLGRKANPAKVAAHRRKTAPWTAADTDWKEKARNALRALTRAQRTGASQPNECGNRGTNMQPKPLAPEVGSTAVGAAPKYLNADITESGTESPEGQRGQSTASSHRAHIAPPCESVLPLRGEDQLHPGAPCPTNPIDTKERDPDPDPDPDPDQMASHDS